MFEHRGGAVLAQGVTAVDLARSGIAGASVGITALGGGVGTSGYGLGTQGVEPLAAPRVAPRSRRFTRDHAAQVGLERQHVHRALDPLRVGHGANLAPVVADVVATAEADSDRLVRRSVGDRRVDLDGRGVDPLRPNRPRPGARRRVGNLEGVRRDPLEPDGATRAGVDGPARQIGDDHGAFTEEQVRGLVVVSHETNRDRVVGTAAHGGVAVVVVEDLGVGPVVLGGVPQRPPLAHSDAVTPAPTLQLDLGGVAREGNHLSRWRLGTGRRSDPDDHGGHQGYGGERRKAPTVLTG